MLVCFLRVRWEPDRGRTKQRALLMMENLVRVSLSYMVVPVQAGLGSTQLLLSQISSAILQHNIFGFVNLISSYLLKSFMLENFFSRLNSYRNPFGKHQKGFTWLLMSICQLYLHWGSKIFIFLLFFCSFLIHCSCKYPFLISYALFWFSENTVNY